MLKISDRSTNTCIVVQASGAISGDDYDDFVEAFEEAYERYGKVNLVVELLDGVRYGDLDAFKEDFEFTFKQYKKARRAAFVGDTHVINAVMKLFSPFTSTYEQFFPAGEVDAALEWVCGE